MIRMDGHRNRDAQFIAQGVDDPGDIPIIDGAVSAGTALAACDFDDDGGVGPLGGHEGPPDDKIAPSVGGHGHGIALGPHGPVDELAADDQGPAVGEEGLDIGRPSDFQGPVKIRRGDG